MKVTEFKENIRKIKDSEFSLVEKKKGLDELARIYSDQTGMH